MRRSMPTVVSSESRGPGEFTSRVCFPGSGRGPVRCPGIDIVRTGGAGLDILEGWRPADDVMHGRGRLGG